MPYIPENGLAKGLVINRLTFGTHRSIEEAREAYEGEHSRLECVSKVMAFILVIATRNAQEACCESGTTSSP